ncbi:MAG TPA: gluconate 2-dehydrogenase subunit 3 family protein [Flavisolibacter sp.]|jgi:hypothetical protein|nr:gluconate 2-dehydrogenase subunit 3 family protein [Flavisolibacter sp.]
MQRRTLLKQLVFITGGVALLPSCLQNRSKASILLKDMSIDGDQEKLLAELSETIIPVTDTPGAKDISAHLFTLMMVDDCYKKEDQQKFMAGLKDFEAKTKKDFSKSYVDLSPAEKEKLLRELEAAKDRKDDLSYFYATTKKLTIQAYTTSKYYLTKVQVYELVPGRYHGCVPVKKIA